MTVERDGPTLQEYCETRFNLLTVAAEKTEAALRERIDAVEKSGADRATAFIARLDALFKGVEDKFRFVETLAKQAEENTKLATATAGETQRQHNVAQNEWRATLTDFRQNTPTRPEFDKLAVEVTALRLELSTRLSVAQGEKVGMQETRQGSRETKEDSRAGMAIVIAAASGIVAAIISVVAVVVSLTHTPAPVYVPATQQAPR